MKNKKILLALSGGIDSSIAAYLLKKEGFNIIGITFKFHTDKKTQSTIRNSEQNIIDAKIIANRFDIQHFTINIENQFKETVINYFIDSYISGKTPNPCVICNPQIKFKYLYELSKEFDCEYIATGHYVKKKQENGRYFISKATDNKKDQMFFLWNLSQSILEKTIFPLGSYTKNEIYNIAKELSLDYLIKKDESFGVCFLKRTNYTNFIEKNCREEIFSKTKGNFIEKTSKKIIGIHSGIYKYTIGQKILIDNKTFYVLKINSKNNEIFIGKKEDQYFKNIVIAAINYQKQTQFHINENIKISTSYYFEPIEAKIINISEKKIEITAKKAFSAPAIGQSVVIYDNNDILAGGFIEKYK